MHHRKVVWIALAAVWLGGCGGDSRGPEPPPPGAVQLVSETPLNAAWYSQNRIPNGHFHRWTSGQGIPDEFQAPDSDTSQISNAGGPARQIWLRSDNITSPEGLFRTRVALRTGVTYRFMVLAETLGNGVASISLWRVPNEGDPELIDPALLTLLPGDGLMKKYACTIEVPEGGMYMLAAQAAVEPGIGFATTWHRWHVANISELTP